MEKLKLRPLPVSGGERDVDREIDIIRAINHVINSEDESNLNNLKTLAGKPEYSYFASQYKPIAIRWIKREIEDKGGRHDIFEKTIAFFETLPDPKEGGRRKLRLNVKRRRTQRHRRGRIHRKLRKLTTRRR